MGTSTSGAQLAKKITKVSNGLGKANREAVSAAALVYKEAVLAEALKDTGGDLTLSHWGWRPTSRTYRKPRLGAYYDVKGAQRAVALLKPKPIGLWVFLEAGASPHRINRRAARKRRGQAQPKAYRRGLALAGGGFAASVNHPGVPGRRTWSRGLRSGRTPAMRQFKLTHQRALLNSVR